MAIKRGFSSIAEHDAHIIKMWNSVVTKRDVVYILGDITMSKAGFYPMLDALKGEKKVILGNHDKQANVKLLLNYVNSVAGMIKYRGWFLTHCPIHTNELQHCKGNVHGHVHEKTIDDNRYINVSCEALDYTPALLDDLINIRNSQIANK